MNASNDYQPARDDERLRKQGERIFEVCKAGNPLTLSQIATLTGAPEASISAQLRTFRKPKGGSHTVNKKYLGNGLYAYTLIVNTFVMANDPTQLSLRGIVSELIEACNVTKLSALDTLKALKGT